MVIATWNVNSIRSRQERVARWLEARRPDVLCLQELKVLGAQFPSLLFEEAGYHAAVFGQRTYNGVAILSRSKPEDVRRGLEDDVDDPEARLISARIDAVRVISAYVPNGQTVGSEKYAYKLEWMRRLRTHLERSYRPSDRLVLCGDMNVAPEPRDVAFPEAWERSVLFHPEVRAALETFRAWGLVDAFRLHQPEGGHYSWWDYRALSFPRGNGLRIDHVFVTEPLARLCREASIDRNERKGKLPSDHAPVVARFDLGDGASGA